MIVLPTDPRKLKRTLRQRVLRLTFVLVTRTGLLALLFFIALILFLTSLGESPPPAALVHASGGTARRHKDILECGCTRADECSTAVPLGSLSPPPVPVESQFPPNSRELENARRILSVRYAVETAWAQYRKEAFGADELLPISGKRGESLGAISATVVEALGTLYVMRLSRQYREARNWVSEALKFETIESAVNVHEVTTRVLGGLISIYQMTGDSMYLKKAEDLSARLRAAFDSLNGIPYPRCFIGKKKQDCSTNGCKYFDGQHPCEGLMTTQSAAGGLSLEIRAIAYHSLRPDIRDLRCKVDRAVQAVVESGPQLLRDEITEELARKQGLGNTTMISLSEKFDMEQSEEGEEEKEGSFLFDSVRLKSMHSYYASMVELWQGAVSAVGGGPTLDTTATFSTPARGFYEYLTKAWKQGGGCESSLRYPLDASMNMLLRKAIYESPTGDLYLRTFDERHNMTDVVVEQSMCYLSSVFHLAARKKDIESRHVEMWHDIAQGITRSCLNMYKKFPGQLGGTSARFNGHVWVTKGAYRLQGDLMEALFYMWQSSKSVEYREEAWKTFTQIHRECKVERGAFTVLEEREIGKIEKGDMMPSEFLGSTMKFLYLIFAEADCFPLDSWIFNRAGHPLMVTPGLGALNTCAKEFVGWEDQER